MTLFTVSEDKKLEIGNKCKATINYRGNNTKKKNIQKNKSNQTLKLPSHSLTCLLKSLAIGKLKLALAWYLYSV